MSKDTSQFQAARSVPYGNSPEYVFDIIWNLCHIVRVRWAVEIGDEFEPEFDALPEDVQTEILALSLLLEQFGPQLGRPRVDTLSRTPAMRTSRNCGSARRMVSGEWPSPSIPSAGRFCSWRETNQVGAKSASTAN